MTEEIKKWRFKECKRCGGDLCFLRKNGCGGRIHLIYQCLQCSEHYCFPAPGSEKKQMLHTFKVGLEMERQTKVGLK